MYSALGTRLTLPCIWRLPRLFCSSYQITRRPLLGTGTRCVTRGSGRVFPGSRDLTKVQCRIRRTITDTREVEFAKIWAQDAGISRDSREKRTGVRDRDPLSRPHITALRHFHRLVQKHNFFGDTVDNRTKKYCLHLLLNRFAVFASCF